MSAPFTATRRSWRLVGRKRELNVIRSAVFPGDDSCQVVFIQGAGGFGKTRLLEETLRYLGHPGALEERPLQPSEPDWKNYEAAVPADLVDLIDVHLHSRNRFIQQLRESLHWAQYLGREFNFNEYDQAQEKHRRRLQDNVEYRLVQEAAREAEDKFWSDYRAITARRRVVWFIDTAEQLNVNASEWLIKQELLRPDQLQFQTQVWLANALRQVGGLRNTTLLLAGRDKEGEAFFNAIRSAAEAGQASIRLLKAEPFTEDEIRTYLQALTEDFREQAGSTPSEAKSPAAGEGSDRAIAEALSYLAQSPERIRLLHAYTGGQPVRLALFADLLVESPTIPEPLRLSRAEGGRLNEAELEFRQWQLEEEVMRLLFQQPWLNPLSVEKDAVARARFRAASLRRDILLALVRARIGLSAEQLHYVIDNAKDLPPAEWKAQGPDLRRLREIREAMRELKNLTIVKSRPQRLASPDEGDPEAGLSLGLQDEIYRIFAEHMAPHVQVGRPASEKEGEERARVNRILERLRAESPQALKDYEKNFLDELRERQRLYELLRDWADHEREALREELLAIRKQEERQAERLLHIQLYQGSPAEATRTHLSVGEEAEARRQLCRAAIRELDLEYMHFAFSIDPDVELNNSYADLADDRWMAYDEDADILTQAMMWRILNDWHALKFVKWNRRPVVKERGEETIDVLRRAARQEDASRWIKRLARRTQYEEAVRLADAIEDKIAAMPDSHEKKSWQHTLVRSERLCWREYSRLLPGGGREARSIIDNLKPLVEPLIKLEGAKQSDPEVLPGERGFKDHPAHSRLRRVISVIAANIAYGYTQLGQFREAVEYYGLALNYVRGVGADAHRAMVLNNLSRALAEMGRQRALRICHDGLGIRQRLDYDGPIGLSHSTLALLYNYLGNPERAWVEAVKAVLLFKRVDYPRGRALASIQLGEALRQLAARGSEGRALPASQSELLRAAEEALSDAVSIFTKGELTEKDRLEGKVKEPLRWVEVRIEQGCLHRDRLRDLPRERSAHERQRLWSTAVGVLQEAAEVAQTENWERLELDARVNLAWTHFYADGLAEAEQAIDECFRLISRIIGRSAELIAEGEPLPGPRDVEAYIYYQLSKLHGLRGRMAMDGFNRWVEDFEKTLERERPKIIRRERHEALEKELERDPHGLDEAADAYLKSIAYAQLFSPRSTTLSILYDSLYGYLKKFNQVELDAFERCVHAHFLTRRRRTEALQLEDLGDVEEFLHESVGLAIPNNGQTEAR